MAEGGIVGIEEAFKSLPVVVTDLNEYVIFVDRFHIMLPASGNWRLDFFNNQRISSHYLITLKIKQNNNRDVYVHKKPLLNGREKHQPQASARGTEMNRKPTLPFEIQKVWLPLSYKE